MPKKTEMTDFEKNLVNDQRRDEGLYVLSIYKNTDYFYEYKLDLDTFVDMGWKFFYRIAQELIEVRGVRKLDAVTVGSFISEQNDEINADYKTYGGYQQIADGMDLVEEENIEAYYNNVQRNQVLLKLSVNGFPIEKQWQRIKGMPLDELNDYLSTIINNAFIGIDGKDEKVEDIFKGMVIFPILSPC